MNILKPVVNHMVDGTLETWFPKAVRKRKETNIYYSNLHYILATRAVVDCKVSLAIDHVKKSLEYNIKHKYSLELAKKLVRWNQTGVFE